MGTPCGCNKPDCINCLLESLAPTEELYPFRPQLPIQSITLTVKGPTGYKPEAETQMDQSTLDTLRKLLHDIGLLSTIIGMETRVHVRRG